MCLLVGAGVGVVGAQNYRKIVAVLRNIVLLSILLMIVFSQIVAIGTATSNIMTRLMENPSACNKVIHYILLRRTGYTTLIYFPASSPIAPKKNQILKSSRNLCMRRFLNV